MDSNKTQPAIFLQGYTLEQFAEILIPLLPKQQNDQKIPETLLSKVQTTELLGITLNTLDKYIKNGTIPAYGLGSRVMLKKQEVLDSLIRINK